LLLLVSLVLPSPALADYHYASHSGSDTYPYTSWETAADTIQEAIDAAETGDTVYIASGEYEQLIRMDEGDSLLALIGRGADSTWVFNHRPQTHLAYTGHGTYLADVRFSNTGGYDCIQAFCGRDLTVERCRFTDIAFPATAILICASNVAVRHCVFENADCQGILEFLGTTRSLEVTNCLFRNMGLEPVNVFAHRAVIANNIVLNIEVGYDAFTFHWVDGSYISVTNNVISNVNSGGIWGVMDDSTSQIDNNTIQNATRQYHDPAIFCSPRFDWGMANNTVTGCYIGLALEQDNTLAVRYTNLWNNVEDFWVAAGSFDTTFGLLHVDPMFASPDSGDFRLQAFSPLIDAGDPNILDVDGSRSDIGAYGGPGGCSYVYLDLAPKIPDSLAATVDSSNIHLSWRNNSEADFNCYQIFRDTLSGFTPSAFNLIAEPESCDYLDSGIIPGISYYYRLTSVDNQGNVSDYSQELAVLATGISWDEDGRLLPRYAIITSAYPNPFNANITIVYSASNLGPQPPEIKLVIYDINGRLIRTLLDERKAAGAYRAVWDGTDDAGNSVASGSYIARLSQWGCAAGDFPVKISLIK
jgi:hypothetical protein